MKIKVLSVIFAILSCVSLFIVPVSASVELPIDVEERYTDITYLDETNVYGEVINAEEEQDLQTKKTVYIAVLSVLLVISIIVLIVTLKRAKDDKLLKDETESAEKKYCRALLVMSAECKVLSFGSATLLE